MARDLQGEGHWYDGDPDGLQSNFQNYLQRLEDAKNGINLKDNEPKDKRRETFLVNYNFSVSKQRL